MISFVSATSTPKERAFQQHCALIAEQMAATYQLSLASTDGRPQRPCAGENVGRAVQLHRRRARPLRGTRPATWLLPSTLVHRCRLTKREGAGQVGMDSEGHGSREPRFTSAS
jgi:hypothetical protein